MKILVIDDYGTMRRIIRTLLADIGHTDVDEAPDGHTALAKLRAAHYDLVISDWNMEPMTGCELLHHVRAESTLKETPFILTVGESTAETAAAAKEAGADDFIAKPFNAAVLADKIATALSAKPSQSSRSVA